MSGFRFAVPNLIAVAAICLVSCSPDNKSRNSNESSVTPSPMGHKNPVSVKGLGFEFDKDANAEGWTVTNNRCELSVSGGNATVRINGSDPGIVSANNLGINADLYKYVAIKMRTKDVDLDDSGEIFWTTSSTEDFATKVIQFKLGPSGIWQTYAVDVSAHPDWTGTVQRIRFDPVAASTSGLVEIDWIRLLSGPISEN